MSSATRRLDRMMSFSQWDWSLGGPNRTMSIAFSEILDRWMLFEMPRTLDRYEGSLAARGSWDPLTWCSVKWPFTHRKIINYN